jgi:hypothetical protein
MEGLKERFFVKFDTIKLVPRNKQADFAHGRSSEEKPELERDKICPIVVRRKSILRFFTSARDRC